ncbi:MAG: DUF362 domain-containing protein [Candidatus Bathyarchaeota archaeon]|nr:MAG: DUF362 domain-containing protein [Candidatus Bathyarchaeota archaeon]
MNFKSAVSIVKGNDVQHMVKESVELIGGIKNFVKRNDRVLLKPSLPVLKPPETGMATDLRIVEALIELVGNADAGEIIVAEGSATLDLDQIDELQEILQRTGAKAVDLNKITNVETEFVKVPQFLALEEIPIPRIVMDTDVFINIPKLKTGGAVTTIGIKNLVGVLRGKGAFSDPATLAPPFKPAGDKNILHQFGQSKDEMFLNALIDLNSVVHSDLTVVDALIGREGRGYAKGRPVKMNLIIAGNDIVAVDAVCSAVMGYDPSMIKYITLATLQGLGTGNLDKIDIKGVPIKEVMQRFEPTYDEYTNFYLN